MSPADVLVVDDDEDIRVSLDRGLRLSGFDVVAVADGEAALAAVAADPPRCIVLDVDLPGASGVEVVARRAMRHRSRGCSGWEVPRRTPCGSRVRSSYRPRMDAWRPGAPIPVPVRRLCPTCPPDRLSAGGPSETE